MDWIILVGKSPAIGSGFYSVVCLFYLHRGIMGKSVQR